MVRINLIPKEILEKRRYERRFVYVYLAGALLAVVMAGVWAYLGYGIQQRDEDLQSRKSLAANLLAQADAYAVFEEKQADLSARQATAQQALAGRVNWAKLSNEISLVLPADVWARGIKANQDSGIELTLAALDSVDSPDMGQKAVARAMVRLNDLASLTDVWLKTSKKTAGVDGAPGMIDFQLTASTVRSGSETISPIPNSPTAPAVPAVPAANEKS